MDLNYYRNGLCTNHHGSCWSAEITRLCGLDLQNCIDQLSVGAGGVWALVTVVSELIVVAVSAILGVLSLLRRCRWNEWFGLQKAHQRGKCLFKQSIGLSISVGLLLRADRGVESLSIKRKLGLSVHSCGFVWLECAGSKLHLGLRVHLWSELRSAVEVLLASIDWVVGAGVWGLHHLALVAIHGILGLLLEYLLKLLIFLIGLTNTRVVWNYSLIQLLQIRVKMFLVGLSITVEVVVFLCFHLRWYIDSIAVNISTCSLFFIVFIGNGGEAS